MKTSTECPSCQGELTLWTGLRAPTPFFIRCPHCQTVLRTRMRGLSWLCVLMSVLILGGLAGCAVLYFKHGWAACGVALAAFFVFFFIAEIVTGMVFYTYARFEPVKRDKAW